MDHVALTDYAMPPGAPRLMPYQTYPFNGDGYLAAKVLELKARHGLTRAFETGTCLGSTTLWLAENFDKVWTCEISRDFYELACARFTMHQKPEAVADATDRYWQNITARLRDSAKAAWNDAGRADFIFLDAHWGDVCPLEAELDAIASPEHNELSKKPVIMIHDWQVPGRSDLGFDHFPDGEPFNTDRIRPRFDAIYGAGGYTVSYNDKAEGAMRGVLIAEPA